MAKILKLSAQLFLQSPKFSRYHSTSLSQQEISAALRPLYFAVHPDLFYQFPKEKEINENSLKQLNFYLETILKEMPTSPTSITFFLRQNTEKDNKDKPFKHVNIQLLGRDVHRVLWNILSSCHLSTEYLDSLRPTSSPAPKRKTATAAPSEAIHEMWWQEAKKTAEDIEERIRNEPDIDFRIWLRTNSDRALRRLEETRPIREETERLRVELEQRLRLQSIKWDCGWGISHFRGCLLSFKNLVVQHPNDMATLEGRTVCFGHQTGVSFEGHVILSSEDVRNNWLEMIRSLNQHEEVVGLIPDAELALSEVLRGIRIRRRKFQPTVMAGRYVQLLGKLTSALYKHRWLRGYPESWPRRMDNFQLVVECEAGPLMLSPTGQFITPASCPAALLVDFMLQNLKEASHRTSLYDRTKQNEEKSRETCLQQLGLDELEKDDDITPDRMLACCGRLLACRPVLPIRGLRLRVSHYYSVLHDGEVCVPWNWRDCNDGGHHV